MISISLKSDDIELATELKKMPAGKRSEYIREALIFYRNYGTLLAEINNGVKKLLARPAGQLPVIEEPEILQEQENTLNALAESMIDMMNL